MTRFLAIFESVMLPIEWTIVNFDLFLSATTAPVAFLPWLEQWFLISADASWGEDQRRTFLAEADELFAYRGTAKALRRVLEIYTGVAPDIDDEDPALPQHSFRITVHKSEQYPAVDDQVVTAIIDMFKPAHTTYFLGDASHVRS
jgi:phage tail-like protein